MKSRSIAFIPLFFLTCVVLPVCVFSRCNGPARKQPVLPTDKLFIVSADSATVKWPVGVEIFVDGTLIRQYRMMFHFKAVKDDFGRGQFIYSHHVVKTLYESGDAPGYTFPQMSVRNSFVDRETSGTDSTRYWETEMGFDIYFSDNKILHTPESFYGGPNRVRTYYTDRIHLPGGGAARSFAHEVAISNGFFRGKNSWSLPAIHYWKSWEERNVSVKMYAQPFH